MTAGLTLVGIGPGDPELMTLAAVSAIEQAQVVAFPAAREGAESMAAAIAQPWIRPIPVDCTWREPGPRPWPFPLKTTGGRI